MLSLGCNTFDVPSFSSSGADTEGQLAMLSRALVERSQLCYKESSAASYALICSLSPAPPPAPHICNKVRGFLQKSFDHPFFCPTELIGAPTLDGEKIMLKK